MSKMEGNLTGLIWGKYNGKGGLMQVTTTLWSPTVQDLGSV